MRYSALLAMYKPAPNFLKCILVMLCFSIGAKFNANANSQRSYKPRSSYHSSTYHSRSTSYRSKYHYRQPRSYHSSYSRSKSSHYYQGSHRSYSSTGHHNRNYASGVARDSHGRIKRSPKARYDFMKQTGYPHGRKGYVIDHIKPLKKGGKDDPSNMQWQTKEEAKKKDKWE